MATVLVADNDPGVRALLTEIVRRQGCAVIDVEDGEAARAVLEGRAIDVLVCDLDMPRLPGDRLLAWLAAQPTQPHTVVVSGYVDAASQAEIERRPGVRAVLRKPFDIVAFGRLVQRLAATPLVSVGEGEAGARDVASPTAVAGEDGARGAPPPGLGSAGGGAGENAQMA